MLKDRLYASLPQSKERRSAQTVLYHLTEALVRMITPILSHTAEEVWGYLSGEREVSPQLASFPIVNEDFMDQTLADKWSLILGARDEVNKALEAARQNNEIGQPLEARVDLKAGGAIYEALAGLDEQLSKILIVSKATLERDDQLETVEVSVKKAEGQKCERCWLTLETVGTITEHPTLCDRCLDVVDALPCDSE
jgi:isoleucyl-tRNA synthetase